MTDLIDRIDALVDEQMAHGEPENGYYFGDPQYPRCPHCNRHWHGLRITLRIARMRAIGHFDPDYRITEDDSPVLCEGSGFIGPKRPPFFAKREIAIRIVPDMRGFAEALQLAQQRFRELAESMSLTHRQWRLGAVRGAPWIQFHDRDVFSGRIAFDEAYQCAKSSPMPMPEGITVEFGPQNWIHEMRRVPPPALQFPRQWPRLFVSPIEYEVDAHWQQFTAPCFPVPEAHGYDFSRYATSETDPIWVHRPGLNARTDTRPAHTAARQRRHGRTRR